MLIFDWYDGPVGGVVMLAKAASYYFYLLDWDKCHRVRVFGLQEVSMDVQRAISRLTKERPKWPVWFPKDLVQPTDNGRQWVNAIKESRRKPERLDHILVWDSVNERAISVRKMPAGATITVAPWFDAIESRSAPCDWFRFLSIPRD